MSEQPPPPEARVESTLVSRFEQIQSLVGAEFEVAEALIEYGVPTFYVNQKPESKQGFTRLIESLGNIGFTPLLVEKNGRDVVKVGLKPELKPGRPIINIALFLATVATVFITGYAFSVQLVAKVSTYELNPWVGAAGFTLALLGVLGVHEMAHKLAANRHKMKATFPYFIPGIPSVPGMMFGIGTFGAVIIQKEAAPNRDALFDIGASGPIAGFIIAILVSAIGLAMSPVELVTELPSAGISSLLFSFLVFMIVETPGPGNYLVHLHPMAFAGFIGMFVTFLNLLPTGMLDGGHTLRSISNKDFARTIFTGISILILLFAGQLVMLVFVLFLSMYKHPGPLDDVSKLSNSRKLVSVVLIITFILCLLLPEETIGAVFRLLGL